MGSINPIFISGSWKEGYALDKHVISSEFLGTDEYGRDRFNTIRSDLGQLVYDLKYSKNRDKVIEIIDLIKPFLVKWDIANKVDVILPIPPSDKTRKFQPVFEISEQVGKVIKRPVVSNVLEKKSNSQSKNLDGSSKENISGTIVRLKKFKRHVNILLIDDLYQSGKTLFESVKVLKTDDNIKEIYVLVMTKTRR